MNGTEATEPGSSHGSTAVPFSIGAPGSEGGRPGSTSSGTSAARITASEAAGTGGPPRLVNATGQAIFATTAAGLVELPRIPSPAIHDTESPGTTAVRTFRVTASGQDHTFEVTVGPGVPSLTTGLPDPDPDVVYIVDGEILLRQPHREDFITPATFRLLRTDGTGPSANAPAQDALGQDAPPAAPAAPGRTWPAAGPVNGLAEDYDWILRPILHSAHTHLTTVPSTIRNLTHEDLYGPEDAEPGAPPSSPARTRRTETPS